jgi:hypothetical protein
LVDTWVVLKQEVDIKKPYIGIFFKHTSIEKEKVELLFNKFCSSITKINSQSSGEADKILLLKCLNDKVQTGIYMQMNYYYWLFEKPVESFLFSEICRPDCAKERVCKYRIKEFIRGFLKIKQLSTEDIWDVKINLTPKTIYYGKTDKAASDQRRSFVALPFPKIKSIEELKTPPNGENGAIFFDEFQVEFGKFLMHMYSGFENPDGEKPSEEFSYLNPFNTEYNDTIQIFEKLNPKADKIVTDEYFGISQDFLLSYKAKDNFKQKELLESSFYDFIFKLLSKKFKSVDEISKHKYLTQDISMNKMKSDINLLSNESK